jgi:hypothetical protein
MINTVYGSCILHGILLYTCLGGILDTESSKGVSSSEFSIASEASSSASTGEPLRWDI